MGWFKRKRGMTRSGFIALARESEAYLEAQMRQLEQDFAFSSYERFDLNPHTAEMTFSNAGVPQVIARVQFVGSYSTRSQSWLWSWANDSMPDAAKQDILQVKQFGEEQQAAPLTVARLEGDGDEGFGWTATAISAFLLKAKGAYEAPGPEGVSAFLIFTDVRWAEGRQPSTV